MAAVLQLLQLLMPLIMHIYDKAQKVDTSTMSVEELETHNHNMGCIGAMCENAQNVKI